MKRFYFILIAILVAACAKDSNEGLNVLFRTTYTYANPAGTMAGEKLKDLPEQIDYSQFGDFLGTITPTNVNAKFHSIRYIDNIKTSTSELQTMVEIIGVNWPANDERRFADFTNGNSIEVVPEMWGNIDNDGWFVDDHIVLKYLGVFPEYFNVEFELPAQFTDVTLETWNLAQYERTGNTISCALDYFLFRINTEGYDYQHGITLGGFVFGEADSTYVVSQNNIPPGDITELISMAQPHAVARIGNYNCPVLTPPAEGTQKSISATFSFDPHNLIQHYAGLDNVPYTFDDVFVFPPKFWERFSIVIEQN